MAKSLDQILKKANSLADTISKRVAANAPYKTGNLRRALRKANNLNTMLDLKKGTTKGVPIQSLTFTIDYAPDDAPYGMWWNDPTVSKTVRNGKTKNIPDKINFVENALNEPKVINALNDIYDLIGNIVVEDIENQIDSLTI